MQKFWDELSLGSPMVLLNGAEIWKGPGEVGSRRIISHENICKLHQMAMEYGAYFWGYHTDDFINKRSWTEKMLESDWMKFGMHHKNKEIMTELWDNVNRLNALEVIRSSPWGMEISLEGVTKESGVREICMQLGIGMEQVMAIGDSPNDMKLLRSAGLGIAMANADPFIKEESDEITDSNQREGVAKAIQKYIFEQKTEVLS